MKFEFEFKTELLKKAGEEREENFPEKLPKICTILFNF